LKRKSTKRRVMIEDRARSQTAFSLRKRGRSRIGEEEHEKEG
jgi:hypothetical protein